MAGVWNLTDDHNQKIAIDFFFQKKYFYSAKVSIVTKVKLRSIKIATFKTLENLHLNDHNVAFKATKIFWL